MVLQASLTRLRRHLERRRRILTLGAQGVVIDGGRRVLLVRHSYRPGWHFPGGGVEKRESVAEALERELAEEAGVILEGAPRLFQIYSHHRQFPGDHIALFVVERFRRPKVPAPNEEIVEQGFFDIDALPVGTTEPTRRCVEEIFSGAAKRADW